jgi:hypothetical protein
MMPTLSTTAVTLKWPRAKGFTASSALALIDDVDEGIRIPLAGLPVAQGPTSRRSLGRRDLPRGGLDAHENLTVCAPIE